MTPREAYLERCKASPQFARISVEPVWRPGEGDIDGFIVDEVVRQGHDPRITDDGGIRVEWMHLAWEYAQQHRARRPSIDDVLAMAALIEPEKNAGGFRQQDVRVGNYIAPRFERVPALMELVWKDIARVRPVQGRSGFDPASPTADDFYLAFEAVHPFRDGNGRTGKCLHNWLLDTLDEPVLIEDWFGSGNP